MVKRSKVQGRAAYRLGFDIGGTFTDVVIVSESSGNVHYTKVPSTPSNPEIAAFKGIEDVLRLAGAAPDQVSYIVHGSTVSANAVLQSKGARTGMITTRGFRDILEIGRVSRGHRDEAVEDVLYNINYVKPAPIVPRRWRMEVPERVAASGEVLVRLDEDATVRAIEALRSKDVESIAVCLLNSYVNGGHEQRIKELIAQHYPEAWISVSSEVLPQFREYERFSTTVLNAYVMPPLNKYLTRLEEGLCARGIRAPLHIMQATGGVTTTGLARVKSVHTALSGFVGGVMGGAFLAKLAGFRNVITLDIGGTSTDISLIRNGKPEITTEGRLGEYPVQIPIVSVRTIGAGGGSLAHVGADGLLKVGPQSAGADPGPACYGKQSTGASITDANLCLGRVNPKHLLDGAVTLHPQLSFDVVDNRVAEPLGMSRHHAATGMIAVQNANISRAIRANTMERGVDPRDCVLAAYGGAGPLHADEIARSLGISTVVIPPYAGVLSSLGLLSSDVRHDYVRPWTGGLLPDASPAALESAFSKLTEEAASEMSSAGVMQKNIRHDRALGLRYVGQGYEISVSIPPSKITAASLKAALEAFHKRHSQLYRHASPSEPVELVSIGLASVASVRRPKLLRRATARSQRPPKHIGTRRMAFGRKPQAVNCKVYRREQLKVGHAIQGPAVIEQFDATTFVSPGSRASVDPFGNLILRVPA